MRDSKQALRVIFVSDFTLKNNMRHDSDLHKLGSGLTGPLAQERLAKVITDKTKASEKVIQAFKAAPRHWFVNLQDSALKRSIYRDETVPIDAGQTMSQP